MPSVKPTISTRSVVGLLALLAVLFTGFFQSCNLAGEDGRAYMQVAFDSTWERYDTIVIAWEDTVSGENGTFFKGAPAELKENNQVPAGDYRGQKIVITIQGIKDEKVAFEEVRHYDASQPDAVVKVVTKPYAPILPDTTKPILPDTTKPILPDTTKPGLDSIPARIPMRPAVTMAKIPDSISIGDTVAFSAKVTLDSGALARYAWDFQGDGVFDDSGSLSGNSVTLTAGRAYATVGVFSMILKVVSTVDSMTRTVVQVRVVRDEPVATAGRDTTVYLGSPAKLRGAVRDGIGRIVKTEWKIGDATFSEGPADTGFQAPDTEGDVACILRATDDDGLSAMDTVVVHVISRSESNLTGISVSRGEISPQFNPSVLAYADTVPYTVASITVTAFGEGAISFNGAAADSGQPSLAIDLPVGSAEVRLTVRREGSKEKVYYITFVRLPASGNADLSGLSVSAGALDSSFSPSDTAYVVNVGNNVTFTTITAVITGPYTSLKVNGAVVASGAASEPINLSVGENPIVLEITAQTGAKKTYRVRVVRAANGNSALAGLTCSLGSYSPAFFAATYEYSLSVENSDSSATLGATTAATTSSLTINGQPAVSGVGTAVVLQVGLNSIPFAVSAQNGAKTTYILHIMRAKNGNANLAQLDLSVGTLVPAFSPSIMSYQVSFGNETTSLSVRPVNEAGTSIDSVNGKPVASGTLSGSILLAVGDNTITIKVTAQSGAQKTYTVVAARGPNGNNFLSVLTVSGGMMMPDFHPDTLLYSLPVPNSIGSVSVSASVADPTASYLVTPSSPVSLKSGSNPIRIEVTAQNLAKRAYVVDVVRAKNGNARLSGLTSSAGTLNPAFSADSLDYSVTVVNTVTAAAVRPVIEVAATSTMTVNAAPLGSNVTSPPIALKEGRNAIPIVVTAEDGTVRTYTVTVTRELPADATLSSLSASSYAAGGGAMNMYLNTPFMPATLGYATAPVGNSVKARVKVSATQALASIRVNGSLVASDQESQDIPLLTIGPTPVAIEVTAPDGHTQRSYTLDIARPRDVVFLSAYNNLYKSFDGGQTWHAVNPTTPITLQAVHFFDANTGIASGNAEVHKTTDGGKTWTRKASTSSTGSSTIDNLQFLDASTGFAIGYMEVLKTTDAGETWKSIHDYGGGIHSGHFFDANKGILGIIGGSFFRTANGGDTWSGASGPNPGTVRGMDFLTPQYGVMAMGWNTTLRTRDGGATFDTIAVFPGEVTMEAVKVLDENTVLIGGEDRSLLRTKDGGKTWVEKLGGGGSQDWINFIRFRDGNRGFVGAGSRVYQTSDAGETWTRVDVPTGAPYTGMYFLE